MARSKRAQQAIDDALAADVARGQVGLGVDIVEIPRMRRIVSRTPAFARRAFTQAERDYCEGTADPAVHYATRFAAKEAVAKALGTGFSEGVWIRDIEVVRDRSGRPRVRLSGRAAEVAEALGVTELPVSLSYTGSDAIACAIAITRSADEAARARVDPAAELASRFKDARRMLDDLPNGGAPC